MSICDKIILAKIKNSIGTKISDESKESRVIKSKSIEIKNIIEYVNIKEWINIKIKGTDKWFNEYE